jgi:hypothetical protein
LALTWSRAVQTDDGQQWTAAAWAWASSVQMINVKVMGYVNCTHWPLQWWINQSTPSRVRVRRLL